MKPGPFTLKEAAEAVSKLKKVAEKAGLISPTEKPPEVADEVLGPSELVELARKTAKI